MIDVGQTVGNYKITARLGEGGMGTVFLAQHPVIGSKVALKAVHPNLARSPEVVSRFVNEAKAVNRIGHDHIVDIHDFGTTPAGDLYFIMEYLHGEMLSERRDRQVAFSPAEALNIAAQIADALHASHEQGVIHRDLKPDNIFLITRDTTPNFVKVLDFGLAKLTHSDGAGSGYTTDAGMVIGTPYYMCPEQCEGSAELDHRADVYALGVILFEMLTGRVPFTGEGYGEVITKHISQPPPDARSLVPDLPEAVDAIPRRALSKNPADRFQSMAEFREALLDAATSLSPQPPLATERDRAAQTSAGGKRNGLVLPMSRAGLFFLGVAALAVVVVANSGVRRQATRLLPHAAAPKRPATVRVNFSSDPDGAIVSRSDGSVLGVTPLSTEIPYSDTPVDFRVLKDGYAPKVSSLVPNLPAPVFVLLERIERPDVARSAPQAAEPSLTDVLPPARVRVVQRSRHHHLPARPREPIIDDGDDVMPPSTE